MKEVQIRGNWYTFPELSHKYHLKVATIRSRYQHGDLGADLVRPSHSQMGRPKEWTTVHDTRYTLRELGAHSKVPFQTIYSRYRQGVRGERLLSPSHRHPMPDVVRINAKDYGFSELSQVFHVDNKTLRSRYRKGDRGERLVRPTQPQIGHRSIFTNVQGERYSLKRLSQASGINMNTLYYRYRIGLRGKELLNRKGHPHPAKHLTVNGHSYTVQQMTRAFHLNPQTVQYRWSQGKRGRALIAPVHNQAAEVVLEGYRYSLRYLADEYGMTYNTIYQRYRNGQRGEDLVRPLERRRYNQR